MFYTYLTIFISLFKEYTLIAFTKLKEASLTNKTIRLL